VVGDLGLGLGEPAGQGTGRQLPLGLQQPEDAQPGRVAQGPEVLATRSPRAGVSGRRNGASSATATPFQDFLIRAFTGGHPLVKSAPPMRPDAAGPCLRDLLARPSSSLTAVQPVSLHQLTITVYHPPSVRRRLEPGHFAISMASTLGSSDEAVSE
jgi:hypothetical protein